MVALAYQQISRAPAATQTTSVPDTGGTEGAPANTVAPDDRGFLEFENTGTIKSITLYVPSAGDVDAYGRTNTADLTYSLPATTGRKRIGPLSRDLMLANGLIGFTIDNATGVTVAALRI
jgi:hypothetical protein